MSQLLIVYPAGMFSLSDVQSMVCEVNKMHDFNHPHVMSLIGVCLDAGPGIAIVMPYMSNGSLVDYLKKERGSLELDDDDTDQVCGIQYVAKKVYEATRTFRLTSRRFLKLRLCGFIITKLFRKAFSNCFAKLYPKQANFLM